MNESIQDPTSLLEFIEFWFDGWEYKFESWRCCVDVLIPQSKAEDFRRFCLDNEGQLYLLRIMIHPGQGVRFIVLVKSEIPSMPFVDE